MTPRSTRLTSITLAGEELVDMPVAEPAASVRLLLPHRNELIMPEWNGNEFLFADGSRPPLRTVTPLDPDPRAGRLTVEVVLHGPGPLSEWASDATPGDPVAVSGPGRGYSVDPAARSHLLAGDESALPAIGQLLAALPAQARVEVLIEQHHEEARVELPDHPGASVEWLVRPASEPPGSALVAAFASRSITDETRVWAAGEAASMQRIRKHLFEDRALPRSHAVIRGYWKVARASAA